MKASVEQEIERLLSERPTIEAFEVFAEYLEEQWEEGVELSSQDIANLAGVLENRFLSIPRWGPHDWVFRGSELLLLCTHAIVDIQTTSNQDLQRMLSTRNFQNILEMECALFEPLNADSARTMGAPGTLASLRKLTLGFCLASQEVSILFNSGGFESLQHLDLSHNDLTNAGVLSLASCPLTQRITHLALGWNPITSLKQVEGFAALKSLDLRGCPLDVEDLLSWLGTSKPKHLALLNLHEVPLSEDEHHALSDFAQSQHDFRVLVDSLPQ